MTGSVAIREVRAISSAINMSSFLAASVARALKLSPLTSWISLDPCQNAMPRPTSRGITPTRSIETISLVWSLQPRVEDEAWFGT